MTHHVTMTTQDRPFSTYRGAMEYVCQACASRYPSKELHYTCPDCGGVFLLKDTRFEVLKETPPAAWRELFDARRASRTPAMQGIFLFYELMAPILAQEDIVWLGEGRTPIVEAGPALQSRIGQRLAFKNEGQNPSGSFKDRGMACAFSYLRSLIRQYGWQEVLTVCASTGDTSASAAMYAAYVGSPVTSVVLLPRNRVTPQQLSQPLGSGAVVLELPGVFDDCMQVVEHLADHYRVALLNSKNSWRILGQESYAFEVAQWYGWDTAGKAVFVPIGNAGNISAVLSGFLKLAELGIIESLPKVIGVQSVHADPVYRYYAQDHGQRRYEPVAVEPSVAQAAMIGNPVSFPRVRALAEAYERQGGRGSFGVVQVHEQEIIEGMLQANRHGHIACTQGGECLAGLIKARQEGMLEPGEIAVLDATAHSLKFIGFQQAYFERSLGPEYEITPREELINRPEAILAEEDRPGADRSGFVLRAAREIANRLGLQGQ